MASQSDSLATQAAKINCKFLRATTRAVNGIWNFKCKYHKRYTTPEQCEKCEWRIRIYDNSGFESEGE